MRCYKFKFGSRILKHWQRMKDLNGYLLYFPLDKTCGATRKPKAQDMEVLQDWLEESLKESQSQPSGFTWCGD